MSGKIFSRDPEAELQEQADWFVSLVFLGFICAGALLSFFADRRAIRRHQLNRRREFENWGAE